MSTVVQLPKLRSSFYWGWGASSYWCPSGSGLGSGPGSFLVENEGKERRGWGGGEGGGWAGTGKGTGK